MQAEVLSLHIYPIKSCGGVELQKMEFSPQGPVWDRQWMIVDEKNTFLTQRTHPKMATIQVKMESQQMHLQVGGENFSVDLYPTNLAPALTSVVWQDQVAAHPEKDEINQALSDFLQKPVKLVRLADPTTRRSKNTNFPFRLSDSAPVLVVNTASLDDLNQRLKTPIPISRFRANIVMNMGSAFLEHQVPKIQIGSLELLPIKACGRCKIITIDQTTGKEMDPEPLQVLSQYRREGNRIMFGHYFGSVGARHFLRTHSVISDAVGSQKVPGTE